MKKEGYVEILKPQAAGLGHCFVFQHNSDPKYTSILIKNHLYKTKVNIIDWPGQSPGLNPSENLWGEPGSMLVGLIILSSSVLVFNFGLSHVVKAETKCFLHIYQTALL